MVEFCLSGRGVLEGLPGEPLYRSNFLNAPLIGCSEYEQTLALIERYNQQLYIDPEMDAEFEEIARQRQEHSHLRYLVWLPFLRTADMWLRPHTELLDVETRWWEFSAHESESWFALFWAGLNLFYLVAAFRGWVASRLGIAGIFVIGFILLRSFFLSSLENPEPRYMLECFPVVLAVAGGAFMRGRNTTQQSSKSAFLVNLHKS